MKDADDGGEEDEEDENDSEDEDEEEEEQEEEEEEEEETGSEGVWVVVCLPSLFDEGGVRADGLRDEGTAGGEPLVLLLAL